MHDILPVFPLPLVAFPSERMNLHIFEPRYLQLIHDCVEKGSTFGIPLCIKSEIYSVGTEMRVTEIVKEYPNKTMDIRVLAFGRFRGDTNLFLPKGKLYSAMKVIRFTGNDRTERQLQDELYAALKELHVAANIKDKLPPDASAVYSFELAHYAGLNLPQKNELLAIPHEVKRLQYLIKHLELMMPTFKMMQELQERAKMNGHFRIVQSDGE